MKRYVLALRACKKATTQGLKSQAAVIADRLSKFTKEERSSEKYKDLMFGWKLIRRELGRR